MLHESAAFSVVLSHSCPPRRATRSVVLSHKISTPPACWPGESKGLYWRDPTVNSCPKEKPPGSPRTFSTVLLPPNQQPSRQARPPLSLSFLHSASFFALFQ
ncbi:hypothetical protein L1887_58887 [Cichorium endivia]|nr:hypothetical protein L1887_58887 [Cichorium endivia]